MDSFFSILTQYKKLAAWTVGGAAVPIASYFMSMAPPTEPGAASIASLTAITEMFAIIIGFLFMKGVQKKVIKTTMIISFFTFLIFMFTYVYFLSTKTFFIPNRDDFVTERYLKGTDCLDDRLKNAYNDNCAEIPEKDIIDDFGGRAHEIWSDKSIDRTGILLLFLWIGLFTRMALL